MFFQHLNTIKPREFNKANWVKNPFGVYFGFDIQTNSINKNIGINHNATGLLRPNPTGTGTMTTENVQGGGIMPTGFTFVSDDTFSVPITPNLTGAVRTDLVAIFFVERDTQPYSQLAVVILDGIDTIDDDRYVPLATLTVPNNFTISDEVTVNRISYGHNRQAAMKHMANTFLEVNTFTLPNYSENNIFSKNNIVLNSTGILDVDLSDSFYLVNFAGSSDITLLNKINTTNVNGLEIQGKYRLCHFQFSNKMVLYGTATTLSSDIYFTKPASIATYVHDLENNIYYLVSVTEATKLHDVDANATIDSSGLILAESLEDVYVVDASVYNEVTGIYFTTIGNDFKSTLNNLAGYEFSILVKNTNGSNPVLLNSSLASTNLRCCFKVPAIVAQDVLVHCLIDSNGDISHDIKLSKIVEDISSTITNFPSPAFQPSTSEPVEGVVINQGRVVITGLFEVSTNTNVGSLILINLPTELRSNRKLLFPARVDDGGTKYIMPIEVDGTFVTFDLTHNVSGGATIQIYMEYSLI